MRLLTDKELEECLGPLVSDKGTSRNVHEHKCYSDRVIKVCKPYLNDKFSTENNWYEWFIYKGLKNSKYEKQFAECFDVSETGKYLVMEKLNVCPSNDASMISNMEWPAFLSDRLSHNFGKTGSGEIKCLDYSLVKTEYLLNLKTSNEARAYDPFGFDKN